MIIVDDSADVRRVVRALLDQDDRFEVVGEGSDGFEAIDLAASRRPDVVILDRRMPRLGGLEALPEIRRAAPHTTVLLFTTSTDAGTYHAAVSAGAEVVDKTIDDTFVDQLAGILVDHWANPEAHVHIRLGPVASAAARAWIHNTRRILSALRLQPDVLDEALPDDAIDAFERFVQLWDEANRDSDEFVWSARAPVSEVRRLVEWWAAIDAMSDDQLSALGVHWAPPEGEPFFRALTAGVLDALEGHAETVELGKRLRLRPKWGAE